MNKPHQEVQIALPGSQFKILTLDELLCVFYENSRFNERSNNLVIISLILPFS